MSSYYDGRNTDIIYSYFHDCTRIRYLHGSMYMGLYHDDDYNHKGERCYIIFYCDRVVIEGGKYVMYNPYLANTVLTKAQYKREVKAGMHPSACKPYWYK